METLLAHCSSLFLTKDSFFLTFFLGGLMGGFTHCIGMCGPMVACGNMCNNSKCSKAQTAQFSYHLGRLMTYGALGFVVALLSKQIATFSFWPYLSAAMLASAGLLFLLSSLPLRKHHLLSLPIVKSTFLRGALLGFMPCGLIYAALMMAATTANPLMGMVAMWIFVLGTIPALLIASVGAELLTRKWQETMQHVGRVVMALNGVILIVMAEQLVR